MQPRLCRAPIPLLVTTPAPALAPPPAPTSNVPPSSVSAARRNGKEERQRHVECGRGGGHRQHEQGLKVQAGPRRWARVPVGEHDGGDGMDGSGREEGKLFFFFF